MDQSSGKMNKDFLGTVTDLLTAGKGVIGRKNLSIEFASIRFSKKRLLKVRSVVISATLFEGTKKLTHVTS